MSEMDEFYSDDEELGQDFNLSPVDRAKLRLIQSIENICHDLHENIVLGECTECERNVSILSGYTDSLIELENVGDMSDEEMQDAVTRIMNKTTEITVENMHDIIGHDEVESFESEDDDEDNGIDF